MKPTDGRTERVIMLNTSRLAIALLAGLTILTADPSHAQLKRFLRRVITDTVGSELTN